MSSKKQKTYTASFKLEVVDFVKQGNSKRKAASEFSVHRRRVQEWCLNEEKLRDSKKTSKRLSGAGRPVRFQDIDVDLLDWFRTLLAAGVRVTGRALKEEALRLHKANGSQSFKASSGWFRAFKKRHAINFRRSTHISEQPKDVTVTDNSVDQFLNFLVELRQNRMYGDHLIGNMDETPVLLELPESTRVTLDDIGSETVSVRSEGRQKMKYTTLLSALADGTKLPVFVLLPGVTPPKTEDVPDGVVIHMCENGQSGSSAEITEVWMNRIWGSNNRERRLLVWDNFMGHTTPEVKDKISEEFNTDTAYIPGGCTQLLQPADVSWNRPFKSKIQDQYDEWLVSGDHTYTEGGNLRPPTVKDFLQWIKVSWDAISPELIRLSFKKCGINNSLDGMEDDLFQGDDDEDSFEGFNDEEVMVKEEFSDDIAGAANDLSEIIPEEDEDENSSPEECLDFDPGCPGH